MEPERLLEIKKAAENTTGPCSLKQNDEGKYFIMAPDGVSILFETPIEDLSSLRFYATARETVLDLVREVEDLQKAAATKLSVVSMTDVVQ